jgi:hypothetical protein
MHASKNNDCLFMLTYVNDYDWVPKEQKVEVEELAVCRVHAR